MIRLDILRLLLLAPRLAHQTAPLVVPVLVPVLVFVLVSVTVEILDLLMVPGRGLLHRSGPFKDAMSCYRGSIDGYFAGLCIIDGTRQAHSGAKTGVWSLGYIYQRRLSYVEGL
jgi:hypothetical protein